MTLAELAAHQAKRDRERPKYDQRTRRYRAACCWRESPCDSLTHWRRFVAHVEQIITQCRREEHALLPFEGRAFMRELCAEEPRLWAASITMAAPTTEVRP
jgi:hypothetical protein